MKETIDRVILSRIVKEETRLISFIEDLWPSERQALLHSAEWEMYSDWQYSWGVEDFVKLCDSANSFNELIETVLASFSSVPRLCNRFKLGKLPDTFVQTNQTLVLGKNSYNHELPNQFSKCNGIVLNEYYYKLPNSLIDIGSGDLNLSKYNEPIPCGINFVNGNLILSNYGHPLHEGFVGCSGSLVLLDYIYKLPDSFVKCNGEIFTDGYKYKDDQYPSDRIQYRTVKSYPYDVTRLKAY